MGTTRSINTFPVFWGINSYPVKSILIIWQNLNLYLQNESPLNISCTPSIKLTCVVYLICLSNKCKGSSFQWFIIRYQLCGLLTVPRCHSVPRPPPPSPQSCLPRPHWENGAPPKQTAVALTRYRPANGHISPGCANVRMCLAREGLGLTVCR